MARRSTQSTKSGKYMNPTDQARKEARRRELKKNKKQRQMVRTAVLKGKNPREIIVELEKVDDMEYNPITPSPLNDKVLKEKRRRLIETWDRVLSLYEKEDPEQHSHLRRVWSSYMTRKNELQAHFESVQNAQRVRVGDIPLPNSTMVPETPMPGILGMLQPKHGILKRPSVLDSFRTKVCPGVPSCPPPKLREYFGGDDHLMTYKDAESDRKRKIRFADDGDSDPDKEEGIEAPGEEVGTGKTHEKPMVDDLQKRMLAMAGQDVDAYLKQMEEVHRKTQAEKAAELKTRLDAIQPSDEQSSQLQQPPPRRFQGLPPGPPPGLPPNFAPPNMIMRPGVPPPGVRLPPGPPPGRPPLRMPPGPPPGIPPSRLPGSRMPTMPRPLVTAPIRNPGVVSAGPQLIQKEAAGTQPSASSSTTTTGSVIESKPQLRNLLSDVTRFVPTKVKAHMRDDKGKIVQHLKKQKMETPNVFAKHAQPMEKDDAYAQFMREMEQMTK